MSWNAVPSDPSHFWSRVDKTTDCWKWNGYHDPKGYGRYSFKMESGKWTTRGAHKIAYQLLVGPVPVGLTIDHLCRTRGCQNPSHMEPVTSVTNAMRGDCLGARNAAKKFCSKGHPYSGDNLVILRGRYRGCRECSRVQHRLRKRIRRALRAEGE